MKKETRNILLIGSGIAAIIGSVVGYNMYQASQEKDNLGGGSDEETTAEETTAEPEKEQTKAGQVISWIGGAVQTVDWDSLWNTNTTPEEGAMNACGSYLNSNGGGSFAQSKPKNREINNFYNK